MLGGLGLAAALAAAPTPVFMVLFQGVIVLAGVTALALWRRRASPGPGVALAGVGGSAAVAALLSYVSVRHSMAATAGRLWAAEEACAGGLLLLAGVVVLARCGPRDVGRVVAGVGLGCLGLALVGAGWWWRSAILGLPELGVLAVAAFGFVTLTVLASASVHLVIEGLSGAARPERPAPGAGSESAGHGP